MNLQAFLLYLIQDIRVINGITFVEVYKTF